MPKIKLNFSRLPLTEKITRARQIVAALTGNASFPTPTPALTLVNTAIDDFETAYIATQAARQEAKAKTSDQQQKEDVLDRIITQLASYVEAAAGDNEVLIQSAGMDLRATASISTDIPAPPSSLAATAGDRDGEIDLTWDPLPGARSYVIEKSGDPPTASSWSHSGVATKSRATVEGLTSGTRYWFRVAAINVNGQSGWSDPAMKIAP
ncbi:MAG TPA: fibronectin type III domain-containing protein [Pyrinomonadaceae bacterium]|nr:fibronectin type III domain-containing protein [Pyrinomonadaceae bacterium]